MIFHAYLTQNSLVVFLFLDQCRNALGMQSGAIPDEAISASSSYDQSEVGPENARYLKIFFFFSIFQASENLKLA